MEVLVGTDIIEVNRIEKAMQNVKFREKVFTEKEIEYCESKSKNKYQHYAARFAAKEAIFKAISKKLNNKFDMDWKNIEVTNDVSGRPIANIIGIGHDKLKISKFKIDVSLSHIEMYAIAMASVMEK